VQQFFAILKDSFREAMDGFVIYVMLGLGLIMVILVASVSYEPEAPEDALPEVLQQFNFVFPDRGKSRMPSAVPAFLDYKAKNATQASDGTVNFTLTVEENFKGLGVPQLEKKDKDEEKPKRTNLGAFRFAVATWKLPAGEKLKQDPRMGRNKMLTQGDKKLDIVLPPNMTPADLANVTDEDMTAFIKSQCALFIGVPESNVAVERKPAPDETEFAFDVSLKSVSGARGWPHKVYVLFKAFPPIRRVPLGMALYFIQDQLVNGLGAGVALLISVVITGFFIPNMLRKGAIDLLISKPIGRVQLLVYKYIGGLTFMFIISAFTIGPVWLVMALRSGYWDPGFLLVIPALTFTFAVVYAVSTLMAVLTRSAIAAIMVSIAFIVVMWIIGQVKSVFDRFKLTGEPELPEWAFTLVDTINNILPRYKDLDKLTTKVIVDANLPEGLSRMLGILVEFPSFGGAVGVSLAFIVLMLALASWRLVKRDN
jgi:ABC-type transport system involved in multi-copper enzyme maturation permease subunit